MILWLPKHSDPSSKLDPQSWVRYDTNPVNRLAVAFYNRKALETLMKHHTFSGLDKPTLKV